MPFFQTPPALPHSLHGDRVLSSYLARVLPKDAAEGILPSIEALAAICSGSLFALQQQDRLNEPTLVQWDAWGNRVDRIEVSPLWKEAAKIAAEHGVVAAAYERRHG